MTPADADVAVARGARVLDERGPAGWREMVRAAIRDGQLDMTDPCDCVLGHVYGRFITGMLALLPEEGSGWAARHGFYAVHGPEYPQLAAAWARLLGVGVPA